METPTELLRAPEIFRLFAGDLLFERVQEIKELIAPSLAKRAVSGISKGALRAQ